MIIAKRVAISYFRSTIAIGNKLHLLLKSFYEITGQIKSHVTDKSGRAGKISAR
jgi:hypothetical protein